MRWKFKEWAKNNDHTGLRQQCNGRSTLKIINIEFCKIRDTRWCECNHVSNHLIESLTTRPSPFSVLQWVSHSANRSNGSEDEKFPQWESQMPSSPHLSWPWSIPYKMKQWWFNSARSQLQGHHTIKALSQTVTSVGPNPQIECGWKFSPVSMKRM